MPTLPAYTVEPIWKHNPSRYCPQQSASSEPSARLPPLPHTADRTVFEKKLVQVLVFDEWRSP